MHTHFCITTDAHFNMFGHSECETMHYASAFMLGLLENVHSNVCHAWFYWVTSFRVVATSLVEVGTARPLYLCRFDLWYSQVHLRDQPCPTVSWFKCGTHRWRWWWWQWQVGGMRYSLWGTYLTVSEYHIRIIPVQSACIPRGSSKWYRSVSESENWNEHCETLYTRTN